MTERVANALKDIFRLSEGHDGEHAHAEGLHTFSVAHFLVLSARSHPHLFSLGRHGVDVARYEPQAVQAGYGSYRECMHEGSARMTR